jgi:penicillin amidase
LLANDPHRTISFPSNRYIVHLVCPGWNVIGATYPHLPGVQIGHNEHVAWGLTLVNTDNADLYVEETDPADPDRYQVEGAHWERMRTVTETIRVKGEAAPRTITLRWTRHGPVLIADAARHRALTLRWAGSEPGTAAYLAAPALDCATDAVSFRKALRHWKAPDENLVFADVGGAIGWHVTGLAPRRRDGSLGQMPCPGNQGDRHEWTGYLPFEDLPHADDSPEGILATANNNTLPPDYRLPFGADFSYRGRADRILQVLRAAPDGSLTTDDFARLQNDHLTPFYAQIRPVLEALSTGDPTAQRARAMLLGWDGRLERDSAPAALFVTWGALLSPAVTRATQPPAALAMVPTYPSQATLMDYVTGQARREGWGDDPEAKRAALLESTLKAAMESLEKRLGSDTTAWALGKVQAVPFVHPLSRLSGTAFDLPPVPHGGGWQTVGAMTFGPTSVSGASYREIMDLADWDNSRAVNTPGQSGQPFSPHYADLLPLWAGGKYFPLLFSRARIEAAGGDRLLLMPEGKQ